LPDDPLFSDRASGKKVWILLCNRTGDDNQVRALATAVGLPFEVKELEFNRLRHVRRLRDERLLYLTQEARAKLVLPWPDLVIGLGYESMPVARFIRRQSRGRTRLVQIGNPRSTIDDIDLLIATPQYPIASAANVLRIPLPIGNPAGCVEPTAEEQLWLESMPRPRRMIAVGGNTRQWKGDPAKLERAVRNLKAERAKLGGSVIAVTSRRTPKLVARMLEKLLRDDAEACVHDFPRFAPLLACCDEFHVTADSVSMLSEAILTQKPVAMIPIGRSFRGKAAHLLRSLGVRLRSNTDLPAFWNHLRLSGLVGRADDPKASDAVETTQEAAKAVRQVLEQPRSPKIWALLGAHRGDNNQVLALAEALGVPFERKQLTYNRWRHLGPRLLGATLRSLDPRSRELLTGKAPDLTISTGHRSVAVVQALRKQSGGSTRSIHVGYPRISPAKFDLVIATPEYPIEDHANLLRLPFALTRRKAPAENRADFWDAHPAPRRLLILGGSTLYWRLDPEEVWRTVDDLLAGPAGNGSLVVVGSPRTPQRLLAEVQKRIASSSCPATLIPFGGIPTYVELLDHADEIHVTADSVAMVSDAISTRKPVQLVPVRPSLLGSWVMTVMSFARPAKPIPPNDLRAFWRTLREHGLIGDAVGLGPSAVPNVNRLAASRSATILGGGP